MAKEIEIFLYFTLGISSAVLAFVAERSKIKSSDVKMVGNVCHYPKSTAEGLGLSSMLLLIIAQITASVHYCRERHQHCARSDRGSALCSFIFSGVTFVAAFMMLLVATGASSLRYNPSMYHYCYILKPGFFAGAGVLVLVTVYVGAGFYGFLLLSESSDSPVQPSLPLANNNVLPEPAATRREDEENYNEKPKEKKIQLLEIINSEDKSPSSLGPRGNPNILPTAKYSPGN